MTSIKTVDSSKFPEMRRNVSRITMRRKEVNAVPPYTIEITTKSLDRKCVANDAVSVMESKRNRTALLYYWEFLRKPRFGREGPSACAECANVSVKG